MAALLDEAKKLNLGSTAHLDQMGVARMNARDASRLGLGTLTHYYGLFESLLKDYTVQPYPGEPELQRRAASLRPGGAAARQDSPARQRAVERADQGMGRRKFVIDPTMTIYSAGRDVMRMRNADWHEKYTLPSLWDFYQPNRNAHGAYWFNWTTEDEIQWKQFYQVWMSFLNDFKNAGGRVTTGSDSGFIYQTYGFGYILELEMLQEAGFHPLEVIRSATLNGALDAARAEGQADRLRHHPAGPARRHGDRRSEPARELQGALRHRRREARTIRTAASSASAASSTRSRTASSTTRRSSPPMWRPSSSARSGARRRQRDRNKR